MSTTAAGDSDFAALSQLLWRYRYLVAVVSFGCALLTGIFAFTAQPLFRAEVVVTDARERGMGGGLGAIATQLGGLATLAGMNLPTGNLGASQEAEAVLDSHQLAEEFIRRNDLLPLLRRTSGPAAKTMWLAVDLFKKGILNIRKDIRRGTTTVSVEWTDPITAARWANGYLALANELIRNRALEDATRNITYLNGQLAKTTDIELRKGMYNLIESETKNLMLANGRTQFAFEVVDPAVPPERKVWPHRLLMTMIGFTVGFGFAVVTAFVVDRIRRYRRNVASVTPLAEVLAK